ncbi:MAG: L,D-transpeptidase [Magnetococcales bacterium]|nr:L,D-transpeptidase [Magnetococcales bacterium]NGZ05544.1 L,D-transpeptidase [Magnetococcales bacterium]
MSKKLLKQAAARLIQAGWDTIQPAIVVLGEYQRLHLLGSTAPDGTPLPPKKQRIWSISTGKAGFGCQQESGCTPTGLHRVCATFGADAPAGTVFKSRQPTGEIIAPDSQPDQDYITTRILWLEGLEEGHNRGHGIDSRERYIYIHGTPHASRIGQPVSAGCIRMRDQDVIRLFPWVMLGTLVWIPPP